MAEGLAIQANSYGTAVAQRETPHKTVKRGSKHEVTSK